MPASHKENPENPRAIESMLGGDRDEFRIKRPCKKCGQTAWTGAHSGLCTTCFYSAWHDKHPTHPHWVLCPRCGCMAQPHARIRGASPDLRVCGACYRRALRAGEIAPRGERRRSWSACYKHIVNRRAVMGRYKRMKGCMVCGEARHHKALDLHAPEGHELGPISYLVTGKVSWGYVKQEVLRCVVLCATCHRLVHAGVMPPPVVNSSPREARAEVEIPDWLLAADVLEELPYTRDWSDLLDTVRCAASISAHTNKVNVPDLAMALAHRFDLVFVGGKRIV